MVHHEILATPNHPAGKGVFTFYGSATINAPAERIWAVLKDFSNIGKWNAYNPYIKTPNGTNAVQVGDMITLAYRPKPVGKLQDVPCKILEVNDEEMRLCWRGCPNYIPYFMLLPEKVQRITILPDGQCLYEVFETQSRPLAYLIKWLLGEQLSEYARGMSQGLKEYAEGLQSVEQNAS